MSDCIFSTANAPNSSGRYQRQIEGRLQLEYKAAWEAVHGEVPSGKELHHTCEHPWCMNVAHLEVWERSVHRAYHNRGERNSCSKLTEEIVVCVMARLLAGEKQCSIARELSVSAPLINLIWKGKRWAYLFKEEGS